MTVVYPEATPAQGNTSVWVVQDIPNTAAPSVATDIGAATTENVSLYLYGQIFDATSNQAKGEAPRRLGDTVILEVLGNTTYTITALEYVFDPQANDTAEANAAKAALVAGTDVWLVARKGLPAKTSAAAATQKVDLHHVRLGVQNDATVGDGEFAEYAKRQEVVYVEPPILGVALVA